MNKPAHWKAKSHRAEYDEMRERLTTAAWDYACREGLKRLTLNAVAEEAGCARSSVYRYFDNKQQLLGAVLQDRIYALGQELDKELRRYTDPREQLVLGLYLAVCAIKAGPSLELLQFIPMEEGGEFADLMLRYVPEIAADIFSIDPVFGRAREEGLLRPDVEEEDILRWMVLVGLGLVQQAEFGNDREAELAYLRKMLLPSIFRDA